MLSPAASYPGFTKQTSATYPGEPGVYYPIGCKRNFGRLVPTDDLEGATPSNWPQQLGPKSSQWYQSYKQQFNSEPDIHALYGYEAMNVVIDAIQRAGSKDRAAIRDAVLGTRNYDGVLGRWSFDNNGDISGVSAPLPGSR